MKTLVASGLLMIAGLVVLGGLAAGLYRVPDGMVGVTGGVHGSGEAWFTEPGLRFHLPFLQRAATFESAPVMVEAILPVAGAAEATRINVTFWLAARRGEPSALLRHAPGGDLGEGALDLLRHEARASDPAPSAGTELALWISERLAPLGLVEGSLRIGDASSAGSLTLDEEISDLARSYPGPAHPLLVIGLDGADWDVMEPMIRSGDLPVLAGLKTRGAWGVLRSMRPTLSPLLWTTVATGRPPDEHGILDFLVTDPDSGQMIPVTSRQRRAAALWNMLSALGQPSLTVGWWATWPAENVEGIMATDRVAYSLFGNDGPGALQGSFWPPGAEGDLAELIVGPEEISLAEVREIIDMDEEELERLRADLGNPTSYEEPAGHLLRVLASTRTYHAIALESLSRNQPPLTLVYYQGIDEIGHRFAHYAAPPMSWTLPGLRGDYERAVTSFYRHQDRLLGELLDVADPQTNVLILSDHGFAWGDGRPTDVPPDIEGQPGRWHTLDGILIAAGPSITPGRLPSDPGLLDVAPTILSLLSLPASAEMPGVAIPGLGREEPRIASWSSTLGRREPGTGGSLATGVDAEMLARLTALGYVDAGTPSGTVTGHLNRGNALLARGDCASARPEFEAALKLAPGYVPPRLGLAQCLVATGEAEAGWKVLESALENGEGLDPALYMRVARYYFEQEEPRRGARLFGALPVRPGLEAARQVALGILLDAAGDPPSGEAAVLEGLRLDPTIPEGLQQIHDLLTRRGDLDELERVLRRALDARPGHLQASSFLALTMERQGRADEAMGLLEEVLSGSPRSLATLANLAGIHIRMGDDARALPLLTRASEVDPSNLGVRVSLIATQGRLGDVEGARESFRAAASGQDRVEMLNALGYALYTNGQAAEAKELLEESLRIRSGQQEVEDLLSRIAGSAGTQPGV